MNIKDGDTIAVWVSCGAASAAAAIIAVRDYGDMCNVRLLNNPIKEEHSDNQRFISDLSEYLGYPIEKVINPKWPNCSIFEVFEKRRFMSSPYGAPCTSELKKHARQYWENNNKVDWHVMGFTYDEKRRYDRFVMTERENVLPILIDRKMTKDDCGKMIVSLGLVMPKVYDLGMPNANCVGCVKASSPTYWNLIRNIDAIRFNELSEMSRDIGAKLARVHPKWLYFCEFRNGKWYNIRDDECLTEDIEGKTKTQSVRIYLDELPVNAVGGDLKKMDLDCGLFCEEKWK